jgi:cell division protein FtsQ
MAVAMQRTTKRTTGRTAKPALPPVELMGGLFGAARKTEPEPAKGWVGWMNKLEQRALWLWSLPAVYYSSLAVVGLAVAVLVGTGWRYQGVVLDRLSTFVAQASGAVVQRIEVAGVVYTSKEDLSAALRLNKGDSLVGFDAGVARRRLEALPWVRLASVERQLPDTVKVVLFEHVPLARLVVDGQIFVINKDGEPIVSDAGNAFPNLPLLQGTGAGPAAGDLFAVLGQWPQLVGQLREAQLVGERRWDLRLVSGVKIQLPAREGGYGPEVALQRLAKLQTARQVLSWQAGQVDLRLLDRIFLRAG